MLHFIAACTGEQATPPQPDVVLVVLDTVRADATSAYDYERSTTPRLSALAAEGVRFDAAVPAGPWTWPTHGSLFTGLWPWEHGAHFTDAADALTVSGVLQIGPLRTDVPTLAERFTAAGYRTVMLSANPIIAPGSGMERGFEVAEKVLGDSNLVDRAATLLDDTRPLLLVVNLFSAHAPFALQPTAWNEPHQALFADPAAAPGWLSPYLGPEGVRLFNAPDGVPGVLRINRGDLTLPDEGRALLRDLYDGEVMAADYQLHRLLTALDAARSRPRYVAVTADHGELLGEGGLVDHGRILTPELLGVPLVLTGPDLPAGTTVSDAVAVHALHPTLLDLAGIEESPEGSLLPAIRGQAPQWPALSAAWVDPHWSEQIGGRFSVGYRAIREDDRLLVRAESGATRLLDLSGPLPAPLDDPATAAAMEARLLAASPDLADATTPGRVVDEAMQQQLRELGYIE